MKRFTSLFSFILLLNLLLLFPAAFTLNAQEATSGVSGILQMEIPNEEIRQAVSEPAQKISGVYNAIVNMNNTALKNLEAYQNAVDELEKNYTNINRAKADQALADYYVTFLNDSKQVIQSGSDALSLRSTVRNIFQKTEEVYSRIDESYIQDMSEDTQQIEQIRSVVQELIRPHLESLKKGEPLPQEVQELISRLRRENPFITELLQRTQDSRQQTAETISQCRKIFEQIDQRFEELDTDLNQVYNNMFAVARVVKNHGREIAAIVDFETLEEILDAFGHYEQPDKPVLPQSPQRNKGNIPLFATRSHTPEDDAQWALEIAGFTKSITSSISK